MTRWPIAPQFTPMPVARLTPMIEKTRIWIVEVGILNWLKKVVTANATPITTTCCSTESGTEVRPEPTRRSTAWLANVAPMNASGAMRRSACQAPIARRACGIPITAPV
jgi:hypothetical protein